MNPHTIQARKAQVRMMEAVVVIFVFFILLVFGLIFYAQIQKSSFEDKRVQFAGEHAISVSLYALLIPELRCTKGENVPIKDCIDITKLDITAEKMAAEQDYYFDTFGYSNITVEDIYPGGPPQQIYVQKFEKATRKTRTPLPVSLYNPVDRTYRFGVLQIEVYS